MIDFTVPIVFIVGVIISVLLEPIYKGKLVQQLNTFMLAVTLMIFVLTGFNFITHGV